MFGCSRLINLFFTLFVGVALTILIILEIPLIFSSKYLTDREQIKEWIKSEEVRDQYKSFLIDNIYGSDTGLIFELIASEDEAKGVLNESLDNEWIDHSIDAVVDSFYDWLEGKKDSPEVKLDDDSADLLGLKDLLTEKLGSFSNLINISALETSPLKFNIFGLGDTLLNLIPTLYSYLESGPRYIGIAILILAAITILSSSTLRAGLLYLGSAISAGALILLFYAEKIASGNFLLRLPFLSKFKPVVDFASAMPRFMQMVMELAREVIFDDVRKWALITLFTGIALIVLSQLTIRRIESEVEEEDDDDEEDERPAMRERQGSVSQRRAI